ncbi:hypothetical protein BAUCODRAFT_37960 [Baudoinia panamericana UAMH 10762]|uniref:Large ribosomal subunit protein mL50 n=1 Tax=Baudoinia panamericana (strain UAMH 10762) TaxID=717646 RepID=M2MNL5_BAUPA|nr:uncharacterized protein BAUCODRAFT_37960 [Baudoinia panamericana UAMH 10762]EMC93038.1 hypothetical protein BAUCODRAFT_37960 [Baudoinia panamericana UAMH 10762]
MSSARGVRSTEQALRLASSLSRQSYVCKACRAQAIRAFSTTHAQSAEGVSFFKRMQDTLFGTKASRDRREAQEKKERGREVEGASPTIYDDEQRTKVGPDGQTYEVAAVVEAARERQYVQATSLDGLETVGSEQWVRARADKGEQYVGFVPKKRIELGSSQWMMLLHHITVELLVLQKAGRPVGQVCYPRQGLEDPNSYSWLYTRSGTIETGSKSDGIKVIFADPLAEERLLLAIPKSLSESQLQDERALMSELEGAVAESASSAGNGALDATRNVSPARGWMEAPLKDANIKMALYKRILQLTGKRIPDPVISTSTTIADLYNHLRTKDKPAKLFQSPQIQRLKVIAPNVAVYSNRRTPIHKEKELGRWKVIEEELVRRDLPVKGSRWVGAKAKAR